MHRVALLIGNDPECIELMEEFLAAKPEPWNEDIDRHLAAR
jgi:hypothetical protein